MLPAFGAFTGMHPIRPGGGERVYAVAQGLVAAVPVAVGALRCRLRTARGSRDDGRRRSPRCWRAPRPCSTGSNRVLPQALRAPDWSAATAFRYRKRGGGSGVLEPVRQAATIRLDALVEVEAQKERLVRNTEQFVAGRGANNVLLTARAAPARAR